MSWFPLIYVDSHKCGCNHPYADKQKPKGPNWPFWLMLGVGLILSLILWLFQ